MGGLGRGRCAGREVVLWVCERTLDGLDLETGCLPFVFALLVVVVALVGAGTDGGDAEEVL